jgi:hypothetical protein
MKYLSSGGGILIGLNRVFELVDGFGNSPVVFKAVFHRGKVERLGRTENSSLFREITVIGIVQAVGDETLWVRDNQRGD